MIRTGEWALQQWVCLVELVPDHDIEQWVDEKNRGMVSRAVGLFSRAGA